MDDSAHGSDDRPFASAGSSPAVPVLGPEDAVRLRGDLADAGYTVDGVTAALGPVASAATMRDDLAPARRELDRRAPDALGVLLRLFALGDAVSTTDLALAFPGTGAEAVIGMGLVVDTPDDRWRAACDLRPHGDEDHAWWVASDLAEVTTGRPLHPDHVLGVGGASLTLAGWTPRTPVGRVLDLGTGCGIQALYASTHADSVIATDLSERALAFAAFNMTLAGQEWDLRSGDMFEPVVDGGTPQTFDLVVSNPPFVISPRAADLPVYEYRDGGRAGDAVVEAFVGGVGAHLAPGGVACFLANWEVGAGEDWRTRWREWLDRPECAQLDAWVVAREYQDVAEYAEIWARDGGHRPGTPEFDRWIAAWLDDFAAREVEHIWFGVVVLQRPEHPRERWIDLTEATGGTGAPMGPVIARGLAARNDLHRMDDQALFARAWVAAPDVTEERHGRPGQSDPNVILVRQGGGFRRAVRADTALAAFVSVCDGDLTADVAVNAIAALTEQDAGELRAALAPAVRELVADGLLVSATAGAPAPGT